MEVIKKSDTIQTVATLFETNVHLGKKVTIGTATVLPGQRLPETGTTFHKEDEYGYIMKGEIVTESGGVEQLVCAGDATFIPKNEKHWCRNDTDTPVEIIWVFVE